MSASLAALQIRFLEAVLDGEALPDDAAPADAVDFYRASGEATRRASLASTYPVMLRLVGEAFFAQAARAYARSFPSASGDLHSFGAHVARFLETYEPARPLAYLPDVARLEWAVHECAHAAEAAPIDAAMLARVPEAEQGLLRVRIAPSVRRVRSRFAIAAIWHANQPQRDGTLDRHEGCDDVLVHRDGAQVGVQALDAPAARFLDAMARGETLERASAELAADVGRLPALIGAWVRDGVIGAFERDARPA